MSFKSIFIHFFLLLFLNSIFPSKTSSEIRIIFPKNLDLRLNSKPIDMEFSSFGKSPSNFHVRGEIYLANDINNTACEPLNMSLLSDDNFNYGDDNFNEIEFPILLIKRGDCSFTTKVRNAQNIGASMVFIANSKSENIHSIIMADDGTGNDIVISSAMITYEDGSEIINFMKNNPKEKIIVDVNFGVIENENEKISNVTFELFFSSSELRAYQFLNNIIEYLEEFGDQVNFIPRYVTHRAPDYEIENSNPIENCISYGKYCYFPKTTTIEQNGRNILIEDIRQKCMYNLSVKKNKINNYFKYLNSFYEICLKEENNENNENNENKNENKNENNEKRGINIECSERALVNAGFTKDYLNNCIKESFNSNKYEIKSMIENDNNLLKIDYNIQNEYSITTFPAVRINKIEIEDAIKENIVIDKICEKVDNKPSFCANNIEIKKKGISFGKIFLIICIFIGVNIVVFILCRNYIQQRVYERVTNSEIDIDGRINNVIANYFSLKDNIK